MVNLVYENVPKYLELENYEFLDRVKIKNKTMKDDRFEVLKFLHFT